jgi:hypothetical protein
MTKRVVMHRKTASLRRSLEHAKRWRFVGTADTSHGHVEIYLLGTGFDTVELRYGDDEALVEYQQSRTPDWQRRQMGGLR